MKLSTLPLGLKAAGGPFDDPALLVTPTNSEMSLLFDCGNLHGLKTRDLQKVRWLFLSHLHIDHLIGFDQLLRIRLFSSLPLTVYGPAGTLETIAHRLKGYAWNLTSGSPFVIRVVEIPTWRAAQFRCHHGFEEEPTLPGENPSKDGAVPLSEGLSVKSYPVQHGVPCLAYRLDRDWPPKFSLQQAQSLGLTPGPWVGLLVAGEPVSQVVDGLTRDQDWLAARLLSPPVRYSLGYLTDTLLDPALLERLADFFRNTNLLCCETAYLDHEVELAEQNLHMTTTQVASLAAAALVDELRVFHFSRRYCETGVGQHLGEIRQVFANAHLLGDL